MAADGDPTFGPIVSLRSTSPNGEIRESSGVIVRDPEMAALARIVKSLDGLRVDARMRVLKFVCEKHGFMLATCEDGDLIEA